MALRCRKTALTWPKKAPKWPQDGPSWHQDGPKMALRWPQDGPKMAPRGLQDASSTNANIAYLSLSQANSRGSPRMPPRGSQEAPKKPPRGPKRPQEAPRRLPRGSPEAPRGRLRAILELSWGCLGPSWAPSAILPRKMESSKNLRKPKGDYGFEFVFVPFYDF